MKRAFTHDSGNESARKSCFPWMTPRDYNFFVANAIKDNILRRVKTVR